MGALYWHTGGVVVVLSNTMGPAMHCYRLLLRRTLELMCLLQQEV